MSFTRRAFVSAALLSLAVMPVAAGSGATPQQSENISVIVRQQPNAGSRPERTVVRLGGRVGRKIAIIDGFVATVPRRGVSALERSPRASVTR